MSSPSIRVLLIPALLALGACIPPAVNPLRPAERLPLVEVEIRNTATQSDDYVQAAAAPARIRMANAAAVGVDVPVTLKNLTFQDAPQLHFGAAAASNPTLDLTLPADGSWVSFMVAGAPGAASTRDKDAVVEVLENRVDGVVLARKSLAVLASPIPAAAPAVQIQVGAAAIVDDYVGWRPVNAQVRLASAAPADVPVTVRNLSPVAAGKLRFGTSVITEDEVIPPVLNATLSLTLPADGSWVSFAVAGEFGHASVNDKDAVLEVVRAADNALLGREGVMVRVRKNANGLTPRERERYLNAVARSNAPALSAYPVYQQIHAVAHGQAHTIQTSPGVLRIGPAFLPWHRGYVLRLERALQAIDPAVALHYWRFDQPAPNVFSAAFMGGPPVSGKATVDAANPLAAWTINGFSGIRRGLLFGASGTPANIRTETQTLALGGASIAYDNFRAMEFNPHGTAHNETGGPTGWLYSLNTSVRDPVFFMLHSNVDRLWAKWQWVNGRKDPADPLSYTPQGTYPGGGPYAMGHYAEDRMWPWDGSTGFVIAGDVLTERPSTAPGGPMPAPVGAWGPEPSPRPRDLVNYDQWALLGVAGLGFAYDDVPF